MPKFLHTADWQIGRLFATFDLEHAPLLAEARIAAVEKLAALATAQGVDAVLVAGDVFDAQTVSGRTVRRLFNALSGYSGPRAFSGALVPEGRLNPGALHTVSMGASEMPGIYRLEIQSLFTIALRRLGWSSSQ